MGGSVNAGLSPVKVLELFDRLRQVAAGRAVVLEEALGVVNSLLATNNYARCLYDLRRFEEAKALLRKLMPVARRVLGDSHETTLKMRWIYARALILDDATTLDDLLEAASTLEDTDRIARRVLGGAHPTAVAIEKALRVAQQLRQVALRTSLR